LTHACDCAHASSIGDRAAVRKGGAWGWTHAIRGDRAAVRMCRACVAHGAACMRAERIVEGVGDRWCMDAHGECTLGVCACRGRGRCGSDAHAWGLHSGLASAPIGSLRLRAGWHGMAAPRRSRACSMRGCAHVRALARASPTMRPRHQGRRCPPGWRGRAVGAVSSAQ
jgi:hypothetical protein